MLKLQFAFSQLRRVTNKNIGVTCNNGFKNPYPYWNLWRCIGKLSGFRLVVKIGVPVLNKTQKWWQQKMDFPIVSPFSPISTFCYIQGIEKFGTLEGHTRRWSLSKGPGPGAAQRGSWSNGTRGGCRRWAEDVRIRATFLMNTWANRNQTNVTYLLQPFESPEMMKLREIQNLSACCKLVTWVSASNNLKPCGYQALLQCHSAIAAAEGLADQTTSGPVWSGTQPRCRLKLTMAHLDLHSQ